MQKQLVHTYKAPLVTRLRESGKAVCLENPPPFAEDNAAQDGDGAVALNEDSE
jgi:hypothetical protein